MNLNNVLNPKECGYDVVMLSWGKIVGVHWDDKIDVLDIKQVVIIANRSDSNSNPAQQISTTIAFAAVSSVLGLLSLVMHGPHNVDVDLDIYLTSGKVIEIQTQNINLVKKLLPFIQTKDPREKYRKMRGV